MKVSVIDQFSSCSDSCESLFLKASIPEFGVLNVGGIYRPPQKSLSCFNNFIAEIFENFQGKTVMTGDFNVNLLDENISFVRDFVDNLNSFGLVNEINLPTYVSPITEVESSCLDHVYHNLSLSRDIYVVTPNMADHNAVSVIFHLDIKQKFETVRFRDYSEENLNQFRNNVEGELMHFTPISYDPNYFCGYFEDFMMNLLKKYFPWRTKRISYKRLNSPWITNEIIACINKKHAWFRLMTNDLITKDSYKTYCKALRRLLNLAECEYIRKKFNSLGNNSSKNWRLLNKLLNKKSKQISESFNIDGSIVHDARKIAEKFNDYFVSHPENIHRNIPQSSRVDYLELIPEAISNFDISFSTPFEIESVINSMKKNGNSRDIPMKFFKLCASNISLHLSNLFNVCIAEGTFPDSLKIAKITPVYKKGSRKEISNYRPVGILKNLSKIFESLLNVRLKNYFGSNDILSNNQFGFRTGKNTELACLNLVNRLLPALKNKYYGIAVFLDFSACFDTLTRDILLRKLGRYGVRGTSLKFIESYLSHRKQIVVYQKVVSSECDQKIGVVQGSKNGPFLYDVYSNDLCNILEDEDYLFFADDTCLMFLHHDFDELISIVGQKLGKIADWCQFNKLSINPKKSEYMIISNRNLPYTPDIKIGNDSILKKDSVKYLGLHVDANLKFYSHADYIKSRLSQFIGISRRLTHKMNFCAARRYYYACVFSVISYCICVWGGTIENSYRGAMLRDKHRQLVKFLFGRYYSDSVSIFKSAKILEIADIYRYFVGIQMYKLLKLKNRYLQPLFIIENIEHNYSTRQIGTLQLPYPRVDSVKFNYEYQSLKIWNSIPLEIKDSRSLSIFKKNFKKYLVNQCEIM